ncbi:hypothetical protein PAPHI01_0144 [Pancytospora philotis]|nr:hypothetical protein PAPHI01_0144 [Pancytospora philotis]
MKQLPIAVYLESPVSLEPADPKEALRGQQSAPAAPRCARRRKRKEALPPYIPYRSIYVEQDLSKLTERQRIMALKFQSNRDKVSKLFLEVNGIPSVGAAETGGAAAQFENLETPGGMHEPESASGQAGDGAEAYRPKLIEDGDLIARLEKYVAEARGEEPAVEFTVKLKVQPRIIRLACANMVTCSRCRPGVLELVDMLGWLASKHRCSQRYQIECLRNKVAQAAGLQQCICEFEEALYEEARKVAMSGCCVDD